MATKRSIARNAAAGMKAQRQMARKMVRTMKSNRAKMGASGMAMPMKPVDGYRRTRAGSSKRMGSRRGKR